MKKTFKRTMGMAMAAVMSVTMAGVMPAAAEESTENIMEYSTFEEYVEYAIPHYIRAQSVEVDGAFYYSNPIEIYDINDIEGGSIGNCVFLFDDDEIIGKMQVWEIDGEYASVFDTYITDEIRGSFEDNYAIALGYFGEDIYSYDEVVGIALLDGVEFEECPDYELPLNGSISKAASMNLAAIPAPYAASASVNITHVRNQQCDYADKHWLCRAACVAMMVNYRNGDSLTTKDVWRAMKTSSNPDPEDDIATVKGAFDKYDYSYNVYSKSISASEVLGALSLDKPVYIEINGNKTSDGSAVCHAVVICGISIDNATSTLANITYTVDDPTSGSNLSYIIKASPSEKVNNISYTPSGYKYTSIQRTIY